MDNKQELPFEKILSYLNLEDRLKLRAVSRGWRDCIDNIKTRTLFFSELKRGHISPHHGKNWLVGGKFDRTFIRSPEFAKFFHSFAKSVLSDLRHLRIFSLDMDDSLPLSQALNSFGQLEELDLINLTFDSVVDFQLNLPSLKSLQAKELTKISQLTLDAPKLQRIHIWFSLPFTQLRLEIVHVEPVESVVIYDTHNLDVLDVTKLRNLKYLYCVCLGIGPSFLSNLGQLKEIHFQRDGLPEILAQKQAYRRDELKIYHCGFLLNHLDELSQFPNFNPHFPTKEQIDCYLKNYSRLADQIRDFSFFWYWSIEAVSMAPIDFWKKFVDLHEIKVDESIDPKNTQQFLQFLKNLKGKIVSLTFYSNQPQDLFDRLPDYCSLRDLKFFENESLDLEFLLRFKELTSFTFDNPIDADFLPRVFKELEFLLTFCYINRFDTFVTVSRQAKRFSVLVGESEGVFNNLDEAISSMNLDLREP